MGNFISREEFLRDADPFRGNAYKLIYEMGDLIEEVIEKYKSQPTTQEMLICLKAKDLLGEEFLKAQDPFRRNAFKLISKMVELTKEAGDTTHLLDEMLHSIFFLGKVNEPPFSPESILMDDEMIKKTRALCPRAFELFSSHLPRRSPFSCVLDMIVLLKGPSKEREIARELRQLIISLKLDPDSRQLIPSTLCVSYITNPDIQNPNKFYGVSMAASGCNARRFVIAASCLNYWDKYVAGAVLTYYPNKQKKPDYDGTIQLPQGVCCRAFSLIENRETPPCLSCRNLFGLPARDDWVYGNCAENESLSNLFKNEVKVKEQVERPTYSEPMMNRYKNKMRNNLRNGLSSNFTWVEGDFYSPS